MQREKLESSRRETTHHTQILNIIFSVFLIRSFGDLEHWANAFKVLKGKNALNKNPIFSITVLQK